MNHPFETETGDWLHPGDWIEVALSDGRKAVGRFSGLWVNPNFGLVAQTVYTRLLDDPKEPVTTYFFIIRTNDDPKGEKGDSPSYTTLRKAKVVPKPGGKKRKAPAVNASTRPENDTILATMKDLLAAMNEIPSGNSEPLSEILARAPADSAAHRVMSRMWRCDACGGTGAFRDLYLLFGTDDAGDECPHCKAVDRIVMLEGAEVIGNA